MGSAAPSGNARVTADGAPQSSTNNPKAASLFLMGVLISTAMIWMIKTLGSDYNAFQILLARAGVMAMCLSPFLAFRTFRNRASLTIIAKPRVDISLWKLASRSLLAFGGQAFGIAAIANLPLAQAQALSFTNGFIVLGLAVLILREDVKLRRWLAMAVGFAGVLVAVQPGTDFDPAAFYAIASAVCFAGATIVLKQLTREADNLTLMTLGAMGQAALALPLALVWWTQPDLTDFCIMICLGLVAIILQNFMLAAYRIGDVSFLSPLNYLRLVTGSILGFFAFGEVPTTAVLIGAGLIIVANLIAAQKS